MLVWMTVASAWGQVVGGEIPRINAQTFRPTIDGAGLLWADDAGRRRGQRVLGRVLLQYVDDPLVYESDDDVTTRLVTSVTQLDLLGGVNVGPARFGLHVPLYLNTTSDVLPAESGVGDLAADLKLTLLDKPKSAIDLAIGGRVWVPTASVENALGNREVAYEITGILSREFGPLLVALNAGTRGGPEQSLENIELNDAFIGRLGLGLALSERSGLGVEASTQLPYTAPLSNEAGSPLEVLGSGYIFPSRRSNLVLRAGAGGGVTPGIGSPDFRVIVGLGMEPRGEDEGDRDGDGYVDSEDGCPDEAEDFDKFEDADGCPDPDNDGDEIVDTDDSCPNDPEDGDGYLDEDGCPEGTLLNVTVIDEVTELPLEVARVTVTGEGDQKQSRLTPFSEEMAEGEYGLSVTTVGYQPHEETVTVPEGPPVDVVITLKRKEDAAVTVDRGQIDLRDTIHFETNSSVIKSESFGLLDEAVAVLRDYPEIERIRIEGHTDERGSDEYNQRLSDDRAHSVMTYFIAAGIDESRLKAVGYGESRPLDTRSVPEAWDKNRRVDFFIEQWAEGAGPSQEPGPNEGADDAP